MTDSDNSTHPRVVSAESARRMATLFNYGNLVAILLPLPLGIFWLGASMFVYAMNRHHPNPRVGEYTQAAAYRFYGVIGFVVVIATFFGTTLTAWIITWALVAIILIPWTIYDLVRIYRETWTETIIEEEGT